MELSLDNSNLLNLLKNESKELDLERNFDMIKEQLCKILTNTVDKVASYTIKSMPIPDGFKDVLYDVKEAFKTKDFKEIISTVVGSSIREGLEILGLDKSSIKGINELKEVAQKGGLMYGVKAGIEIIAKKHFKNNIVGNYEYEFFNQLKDSPLSNTFLNKIDSGIEKIVMAKNEFLSRCKEFREAYEKFDMEKMVDMATELQDSLKGVKQDIECIRENKTIQNIVTLVKNRKEKLTEAQLKLCNMM